MSSFRDNQGLNAFAVARRNTHNVQKEDRVPISDEEIGELIKSIKSRISNCNKEQKGLESQDYGKQLQATKYERMVQQY